MICAWAAAGQFMINPQNTNSCTTRFQFNWSSRTVVCKCIVSLRSESLRDRDTSHGGKEGRPVRLSPRTVSSQHKSLSLRPCNGWPSLTFSLVGRTCRYKGQTTQITWICRKRRLKVELEGKAGGGGVALIWESNFRPNKYFPRIPKHGAKYLQDFFYNHSRNSDSYFRKNLNFITYTFTKVHQLDARQRYLMTKYDSEC